MAEQSTVMKGSVQGSGFVLPVWALIVCPIAIAGSSYLVGNYIGTKNTKKKYESRMRDVLIRVKTYEAQQKNK